MADVSNLDAGYRSEFVDDSLKIAADFCECGNNAGDHSLALVIRSARVDPTCITVVEMLELPM